MEVYCATTAATASHRETSKDGGSTNIDWLHLSLKIYIVSDSSHISTSVGNPAGDLGGATTRLSSTATASSRAVAPPASLPSAGLPAQSPLMLFTENGGNLRQCSGPVNQYTFCLLLSVEVGPGSIQDGTGSTGTTALSAGRQGRGSRQI